MPARLLRDQGLAPGTELVVETAGGGLILLHRPDPYEVEIYTDERLTEFAGEDQMSEEAAAWSRQ